MSQLRPSSRRCPQCGWAIARIPRRAEDRIGSQTVPIHRYRCSRFGGCGWEGTLLVDSHREPRPIRDGVTRLAKSRIVLWTLVGIATVALAAGGAMLVRAFASMSLLAGNAQVIPSGVSDFGRPLPEHHPFLKQDIDAGVVKTAAAATASSAITDPGASSDEAPLSLREGCAWGEPGRNPYKGTVRQALKAARLPPDVVTLLERKIENRQLSDRLEIRNDKIRGVHSGTTFDSRAIKMTYGKTLCLNSRVNFIAGHVERADLYEVSDARGATYSVMVPYVCGNVSVLVPHGKSDSAAGGGVGGNVGGRTRGGQGVLQPLVWGTREMPPPRGNSIPEPETWALMLGGLALLGWFTRHD